MSTKTSYFFPPSEGDLDKPFSLLKHLARDIAATRAVFEKLYKKVNEFPTVGSERSKTELLRQIHGKIEALRQQEQAMSDAAHEQHALAKLIQSAFHDPMPEADPAAAYFSASTYDRRK